MAVQTQLITAKEFEQMTFDDAHVELVRGEIVQMTPAGGNHGEVALAIGALIRTYVRQHQLGKAYAAETGFVVSHNPDTVRAPDVAFIAANRARPYESFVDGAPDLVVEVVSPGDSHQEVEQKVLDYLEAGTKLIWIVQPRTRTLTVYRSLKDVRILTENDTLDGNDVLPGFNITVKEIFS